MKICKIKQCQEFGGYFSLFFLQLTYFNFFPLCALDQAGHAQIRWPFVAWSPSSVGRPDGGPLPARGAGRSARAGLVCPPALWRWRFWWMTCASSYPRYAPLLPVTGQAPLNRRAPDVRTPRESHVWLRATGVGWLCHPGAAAPGSPRLRRLLPQSVSSPGCSRDGAGRLGAASRTHLLPRATCHVLAPRC